MLSSSSSSSTAKTIDLLRCVENGDATMRAVVLFSLRHT